MVRKRSNSLFLVINVVVSISVALLAILIFSATQTDEEPRARPTIVLVVTATPDPNQPLSAGELQSTVDAQAGTIAAQERTVIASANQAAVNAATAEVAQSNGDDGNSGVIPPQNPSANDADLPTLDPTLIPRVPSNPVAGSGGAETANTQTDEDATPVPDDGCERYFVQSGDTAGAIATRYGVTLADLYVLNGITDQTILQIGDELLIPSAGCEPEIPPTATPSPRPTFNLTVNAPQATPTDIIVEVDSDIEIVQVLNPGDITAEQVEIQNLGSEINLAGWTLSDEQGNIYSFSQVRLVPGSVIRVLTRSGNDTPGFLYWNLNTAVWEDGELVTLSDANDVPQAVYTVGGEVIDFGEDE